ncbi:MAG: hypothetical protein JWO69_921 [Thermoleophilia bacterium]|jgi:cell wall-associated NlpC family hydrolase|nr:hypothetical protein [Thermoleophilia bacterium]
MRSFFASTTSLWSTSRTRVATLCWVVVALSLAVGIAAPSTVAAAPLAAKQAQAAALDREVAELESKFASLQEKHRGALIELDEVQAEMRAAQRRLKVARADLDRSKVRLEERAVAIYRDGSGDAQLLNIAQAGSLTEFFDKLETIERVGSQDARILNRVRDAAQRVAKHERTVRASRDRQAKVVKRAATSKKKMSKVLGQKQAKLGSVTAEIRTIMARQRAAAAARDTATARGRVATITAGGTVSASTTAGTEPAAGGAPATGSEASPVAGADPVAAAIPLPPQSGAAAAAAGIAMGKVGAPYRYGAAGPDSFDCSGLVVWAFAQAGRGGLPHSTYSLIGMGVEVPMSQAQVGDLVFTNNSGHMGIYVGGNSFVHAPRTGRNVTVESLAYYTVVSIRRI